MAKVLVAGINGFVGQHVARALQSLGHSVIGIGTQDDVDASIAGLVHAYYSADLTHAESLKNIDLSDISSIINLAGLAKVGESYGQDELYLQVNVATHTTIYEHCLNSGVKPRIISVSTGAVYDPQQALPLSENSELIDPAQSNPYVRSKIKMEQAAAEYRGGGLEIIVVRPFNHSGPGQLPGFLLPDLAQQIEEAIRNNTTLKVGDLTTKRDYTDVRDVAMAYALLATCEKDSIKHSIYNVCSGSSHSGNELLELLLRALQAGTLSAEVDPKKLRPNDILDLYGTYERIKTDTGWEPAIPFSQMIIDFANWHASLKTA